MISTELKLIVDPNNKRCCEHHLAHKCKEWGFKQGYQIQILFQDGSTVIEVGLTGRGFEYREWCQKRYEPQMLIRACEWILSQTKLQ